MKIAKAVIAVLMFSVLVPAWSGGTERRPLKMVFPTYPWYAVKGNHEGTVIATFDVGKDGRPQGVKLEGPALFNIPVTLALEKWVYPESEHLTRHRLEIRFKRVLARGIDLYDEVVFLDSETIEVHSRIPQTMAHEILRR